MTTDVRPASALPGRARSQATACTPFSASDVELAQVTSHGWRVTDCRLVEHDPARLLAFIERRDERFEVLQLGAGFELHELDSLAAAVDFVVATAPGFARRRFDAETPRPS